MVVALTLPNPMKYQYLMNEQDDGLEMRNVPLDIIVQKVAQNQDHAPKEHMVSNQKPFKVLMAGHHQVIQFLKDFGSKVATLVHLDIIVIKLI